jgi:hypothetical protein
MKSLITICFSLFLLPQLLLAQNKQAMEQTSSFKIFEYNFKNTPNSNLSNWSESKIVLPNLNKIASLDLIHRGDSILLLGTTEGEIERCGRKERKLFFIRYSLTDGSSSSLPIEAVDRLEAKLLVYGDGILLWGGKEKTDQANNCILTTLTDGDFFSYQSNSWKKISAPPVNFLNPQMIRKDNSDDLLFWGESDKSINHSGSGYILSLKDNTWREISTTPLPLPQYVYSAIGNSTGLFLWSPSSNIGCVSTGAYYSFEKNSWSYTPNQNSPFNCLRPIVSRAGDAVLVWGGKYRDQILNSGSILNLSDLTWKKMAEKDAPLVDLDRNSEQYRSVFTDKFFSLFKIESKGEEFGCTGSLYNRSKDSWEKISTPLKKLPPEHLLLQGSFGVDRLNPNDKLQPYVIKLNEQGVDFCGFLEPLPDGVSDSSLFQVNGKLLLLTWKKLI